MSKWKFARSHALPGLTGLARAWPRHPVFTTRLFFRRLDYFLRRQFSGSLATPDSYQIETANELISYWSFFIERECWASDWVPALRQASEPVVLDVGANAGLFSHLVRTLNPGTNLVIFEPLPRMAQKLERWKDRLGAKAVIHNMAVSNQPGTAEFYTSSDHDTTASLIPQSSNGGSIQVRTTTLDRTAPAGPVLLVKIDVEGHEPAALSGAKDLLERTRFLIVEAHTPEALRAIQAVLSPAWKTRRIGASDHLFFK